MRSFERCSSPCFASEHTSNGSCLDHAGLSILAPKIMLSLGAPQSQDMAMLAWTVHVHRVLCIAKAVPLSGIGVSDSLPLSSSVGLAQHRLVPEAAPLRITLPPPRLPCPSELSITPIIVPPPTLLFIRPDLVFTISLLILTPNVFNLQKADQHIR